MRILFVLFASLLICSMVGCGGDDPSPSGGGVVYVGGSGGEPGGEPENGEPNGNENNNGEPNGNVVADPPIDGILQRGGRVEVTNMIFDDVENRLNIREPEGIESSIVGKASQGATGTILDGPVLGDGWTWWEISWDNNGKVVFNEGEKCCIGWSAETNLEGDTRYLTEIE